MLFSTSLKQFKIYILSISIITKRPAGCPNAQGNWFQEPSSETKSP